MVLLPCLDKQTVLRGTGMQACSAGGQQNLEQAACLRPVPCVCQHRPQHLVALLVAGQPVCAVDNQHKGAPHPPPELHSCGVQSLRGLAHRRQRVLAAAAGQGRAEAWKGKADQGKAWWEPLAPAKRGAASLQAEQDNRCELDAEQAGRQAAAPAWVFVLRAQHRLADYVEASHVFLEPGSRKRPEV